MTDLETYMKYEKWFLEKIFKRNKILINVIYIEINLSKRNEFNIFKVGNIFKKTKIMESC